MIRAILFDLDGVLADSEGWWDEIDAAMLREHGVEYRGEHKMQVLGKSFALSLGFYQNHYGLRATIEELMLRRREIAADFYANHIAPFPQARDVLQQLRANDFKLALATSSIRAIVAPFLDKHELTGFFDFIVTGDEVQNGKPAPDIYLKAARAVENPPQDCLVIEDALAGVQAGKSAGCVVAAIPDARWTKREDFADADYLLEDLSEISALAEKLHLEKYA